MIYWALLLHFYQPPTQIHSVLNRITEESYRPLLDVLENNSHARVTVNINGVLTEMLMEHGKSDVVSRLASLAERGQIEFTGSAKYHAVLPLIPQEEILKQIVDNYHTNRKFIGSSYNPRGFFPPEMCYSRNIVEPILNTGYEWITLSGVACPVDWPMNTFHYVNTKSGKLITFFRDDVLSNRISFHEIDVPGFIKHLKVFAGNRDQIYIFTAMDAETFGHHIKHWERDFLGNLYSELRCETESSTHSPVHNISSKKAIQEVTIEPEQTIVPVTISELLSLFKSGAAISPLMSSWSTTAEDLKANNPFPLWNDPGNPVHRLLWEHLNLAIEMTDKANHIAETELCRHFASIARETLDAALHSDQFWWASKRPNWDINMINRGLMLQQECLLNAYYAIKNTNKLSAQEKQEYRYRRLAAGDIVNRIQAILFNGDAVN